MLAHWRGQSLNSKPHNLETKPWFCAADPKVTAEQSPAVLPDFKEPTDRYDD
jgi:hypothetical protein